MDASLRGEVRSGRLILDEPMDLPDGTVVELVPADTEDALDQEDRERLHAAIDRGIADARAGRTVPASEVLAKLRAMRRP
jgi:hypothetical protein